MKFIHSGTFIKSTRYFRSSEEGSIVVEFGLIAVVLMSTVLSAIEFIAVMDQSSKLSNAARLALEHALENPTDIAGITEVAAKSEDLNAATLDVSVNEFCECPDGGTVNCADTCDGGGVNNKYITVSLSQPAKSYIQGSDLLGITLNRSATMRLR